MIELWQTTWNGDAITDGLKQRVPVSPWRPAMWTNGIVNADNSAQDIQRLARLCRNGGLLKDGLTKDNYDFMKMRNRQEIFAPPTSSGQAGELVPKNTLIVADFEGRERTDYPKFLCGNLLKISPNFVQYPGFLFDDLINFEWTSQMRENDLFVVERAWAFSKTPGTFSRKIRETIGAYALMELYLADPSKDPETHEREYRAYNVLLAAFRAKLPRGIKMLALVRGSYPDSAALYDDGVRHRLARYVVCMFDGVWAWGGREAAAPLMADIAILAADPLHTFAGQEN